MSGRISRRRTSQARRDPSSPRSPSGRLQSGPVSAAAEPGRQTRFRFIDASIRSAIRCAGSRSWLTVQSAAGNTPAADVLRQVLARRPAAFEDGAQLPGEGAAPGGRRSWSPRRGRRARPAQGQHFVATHAGVESEPQPPTVSAIQAETRPACVRSPNVFQYPHRSEERPWQSKIRPATRASTRSLTR